jgi:hypothetical protein
MALILLFALAKRPSVGVGAEKYLDLSYYQKALAGL